MTPKLKRPLYLSTFVEQALEATDRLLSEGNTPTSRVWNEKGRNGRPSFICLFCLAGSLMERDTFPEHYSKKDSSALQALEEFRKGFLDLSARLWRKSGGTPFSSFPDQPVLSWAGQAEWKDARPLLEERLTLLKSLEKDQ